jgi:hypothetical protein
VSRWLEHLQKGETVCWEGRPAPRAFVFRHWRWSVGSLLFGLTALAVANISSRAGSSLSTVPFPGTWLLLSLLFFWGTVGHLFYARLAWEKEFYALTDRRLLVKSGLFRRSISAVDRKDLKGVDLRPMGGVLATVSLGRRDGSRPVELKCLEHPQILMAEFSEAGK